jgi:hypothetical protein
LSATADVKIIKQWWQDMPDANVAVATGRASGIFIVDIDGPDAEAELRKLEAQHGPLPPSIETITPRPGRHVWLRMPDTDIRNSASRLGPGLDVRGSGGFCLVAPSVHPSGARYHWSVDCADAIADPPPWLLERIASPTNGNGCTPPADWAALVAAGVDEGARDSTVTRLAGYLLRRYVDPHTALDFLLCWNALRCRPPLPDEDVTRIVNSICGKELRRRGR